MKYKNARDIFPENLLNQIQKYVSGELIYIPAKKDKKAWGETSGYQRYLFERNLEIKRQFHAGADVEQLADTFHLSVETIKKIIYAKKEDKLLDYSCSLSSAKEYAEAGKIDEWIHTYLYAEGHNQTFSDGLKLFDRYFIGPITIPLSLLHRCCGPESNMRYQVDADWFEVQVGKLQQALRTEKDMPPLIVHYVEHDFELNDGNHRLEACNRLGIKEYPIILWITEEEEYKEFGEKYPEYLKDAIVIRK